MSLPRILVLCTGNSCRSQMAEAFLRKHGGDRFDVHSAGLEPKEIHPMTRTTLQEVGIAMKGQHAKSIKKFLGKVSFRYVIIVCDRAEKQCPAAFLTFGERLFWPFPDPAQAVGTQEQQLEVFREVRDQIEHRALTWLASIPNTNS